MPQLKSAPITPQDMLEYLESTSDFSFELRILQMVSPLVTTCEHGGTYTDPVTNKTREFDIRACLTAEPYRVWLPIECKNVREYFPVLVSCVPRRHDEAYHEVMLTGEGVSQPTIGGAISVAAMEPRGRVLRYPSEAGIYMPGDWVGKATTQVGRARDGSLVTNDNEIFDKWSQVLSSASDLAQRLDHDEDLPDGGHGFRFAALVPIVVVPERMLWRVTYEVDGSRKSSPEPVDRVSCFVGKEYEVSRIPWLSYNVSHLELVTPSGLSALLKNELLDPLFDADTLGDLVL